LPLTEAAIGLVAGSWNIFVATMYLTRGWKWPPVLPLISRARGRPRAFILIVGSIGFMILVPPNGTVSQETKLSLQGISLATLVLYLLLALRKPRPPSHEPDLSTQPSAPEKKAYFWDS
jgi:hypothetical protein